MSETTVMTNDREVNIAISFGGTKIAIAIVGEGPRIINQTDRIEWRNEPVWKPEAPLESLLALVTSHAKQLLQEADLTIENVNLIGIAWPGPGRYSEGILSATFIPDCIDQPIHQLLLNEFRVQFGSPLAHLKIVSCLDVNARAQGEVRVPRGAFYVAEGSPKLSGLALNIATGIAGAIVREGNVLSTFGALGETYGQWGRYLFKNRNTGAWVWKPTQDGSIPEHDVNEIRFTELCGGPALARRFTDRCRASVRAGQQLPPDFASILNDFPIDSAQRDLQAEKALLIRVTQAAYDNDGVARSFVEEVGTEIAGALRCLLNALGEATFGKKLVLTGGIGEFLGTPPQAGQPDILLTAIQSVFQKPDVRIVRSALGLDAEFIGFAP